jgi:hypothetical protein
MRQMMPLENVCYETCLLINVIGLELSIPDSE